MIGNLSIDVRSMETFISMLMPYSVRQATSSFLFDDPVSFGFLFWPGRLRIFGIEVLISMSACNVVRDRIIAIVSARVVKGPLVNKVE